MRIFWILALTLAAALFFWMAASTPAHRQSLARPAPAELSHDEMMQEQERRDRAVEEERERDDL